jgi:hypothetical protein
MRHVRRDSRYLRGQLLERLLQRNGIETRAALVIWLAAIQTIGIANRVCVMKAEWNSLSRHARSQVFP